MNIIVDDNAKNKIESKKENTVHCFLFTCISWGGTHLDPTVRVGKPSRVEDFNKFENNGITVYVKKGTPCPSGTLTITTGSFLWFEKIMVEGMLEHVNI